MGLDMWMYGIKDISNEDIPDGMPESWYEENGYKLITHYDDDNDFEQMFHDMCDYSTEKNVEYSETDFDKVKKDYGIKKEAYLSYFGGNKIGFSCKDYYKEIDITQDELDKYEKKVFHKALVFKRDELAYWRKEYDLQNLIYNEYNGQIYNCGFHRLNKTMMTKINRYLKSRDMSKQNINSEDYVAKMYHEWY